MNDSTDTTETVEQQSWYDWWSSKTGMYVATAILVVVSAVLLFGQLASLGVWEPWEADEILSAREYAPDADPADADPADDEAASDESDKVEPNWVTPTLDGEPVARPLLKTWLVAWSVGEPQADGRYEVGALERSARFPIAVAVFVLVLLTFLWIKTHHDTWSALLTSLALVSTPAIFLGVHALSTETLFVVLSSWAIMAFFELAHATDDKRRWLWGALLGVALSLCFLEQRFFGLLGPLAVIVGYALTQIPFEQIMRARHNPSGVATMVGRLEIGLCVSALLAAGGVIWWGVSRSADAVEDAYFLPHVLQWIAVLVPSFILLAGVLLARRTHAVRSLTSLQGLLATVMPAAVIGVVVYAYGQANPVTSIDGSISGKMPLFSFLLENHLTGSSMADDHLHFAMWVRQVGFSLIPWVALVPLGIGYLARSTRLTDDDGKPRMNLMSQQADLKRLLLVWSFIAGIVLAVSAGFDHHYYAGYLPLIAGVGLMLGDRDFWKTARLNSLLAYAMGVVAIAVIMMLGKDLERFPDRFMEAYLGFQEDLDLPDDFSYGSALKAIKYGWMVLMASFFFGLVSWAALTLESIREFPGRFRRWRERRRSGGDEAGGDEPGRDEPSDAPGRPSPLLRRARRKEEFRAADGVLARLARIVELPGTWSALIAAAGVATAGVFLFSFAPSLSAHLSQRGIFQTYTEHAADDEMLYRYNVSVGDNSVYLGDVAEIPRSREFLDRFDDEERFFVVIPRDRLAALNTEVRKRYGRNLPVLDASSSRLLLASNKLEEGESQENFISGSMVDDPDNFEAPIPLEFADDGQVVYATFDDHIEFVGWDIDRKPDDGTFPTYNWGEKAKMTFYFRVKKRIPGQQKIFMHVDFPGSRLHGDHDPVGGDFPTNYWLPGDIVKDEFELDIESYSSPGVYTIWLGFFRSSNRMQVTPKQAHDGQNRMMVGKIAVEGML